MDVTFACVAAGIGLFVASFLLGSIPWGVIISKTFYHTDIREHGSGNIGTTNAMRTMGKAGGIAVFLLDFGKGIVAGVLALVALWLFVPGGGLGGEAPVSYDDFIGIAFLGCIWGHIFCPWLGWHGGKGIAVAVGCMLVTFGPIGALIELAIFIVVVFATRYVSAGSLTAAVACPFLAAYYFLYADFAPLAFACCLIAALTVVWAHRENIGRLRAGTENRIGAKKTEG